MSPLLFVAVAVAGGLGAGCRLVLDGLIRSRVRGGLPLGTIVINLTGSFALGLIAGLTVTAVLPEELHLVVGVGFLGGYTTFSTASLETVRLLQERRWLLGALNGLGVVVAATLAAGIGMGIASLVPGR